MRIHEIPNPGKSVHSRKRVGRGEGNGRGKTCCRGHKGQRSRSGSSQRPGFESGHVPLYRRLPRRGFNNALFRTSYTIVNIEDFAALEGVDSIDLEVLKKHGVVRRNAANLKVLGEGELSRPLSVTADRFSATARQKIEAAGGRATTTGPQPEVAEDNPQSPAE